MYGNNIQSTKIKRVLVPLDDTSISGRWFFPEDPELDRKKIVGLSVSFSGSTGDITANPPLFSGAQQIAILNKNQALSKAAFLTIYSYDNTELVANFPLNPLFNDNGNKKNRIVPIVGRIKTKQSYIFIQGSKIPPANRVVAIWLNFYYL
jgi:hypothetical protein